MKERPFYNLKFSFFAGCVWTEVDVLIARLENMISEEQRFLDVVKEGRERAKKELGQKNE